MPDGKRCGPSLIAKQEEAERAGFEPAVRFDPHTAFPVPHLRPLGHLSELDDSFAYFYLLRHLFANLCPSLPLLTFLLTVGMSERRVLGTLLAAILIRIPRGR